MEQGLNQSIVRGAYTAREALIRQMAANMEESGLTVIDMLVLATWGEMAEPTAL